MTYVYVRTALCVMMYLENVSVHQDGLVMTALNHVPEEGENKDYQSFHSVCFHILCYCVMLLF